MEKVSIPFHPYIGWLQGSGLIRFHGRQFSVVPPAVDRTRMSQGYGDRRWHHR